MNWMDKERICAGVSSMLEVNLAVRQGESVLIMTDLPGQEQWRVLESEKLKDITDRCILARTVADLAIELKPGSTIIFFPFPSVGQHGKEPDPNTAETMCTVDVIIAITSYSLSHTEAREKACKAGARMASMPMFLPQMFEGPMMADYHVIAEEGKKMAQLLTDARSALITTPLGTELHFNLEGRKGEVDTGLITSKGRFDNLPAGEAFIAPLEGKAEGWVVVTPQGYAPLTEPMTIYFTAGEVSNIKGGGKGGEKLVKLLELPASGVQSARRNLAEFGVGTNPRAKSVESLLEAEKIKGTVHIAIGDNSHFGGTVQADLHEDLILWEPDLFLDGKLIINKGQWLV